MAIRHSKQARPLWGRKYRTPVRTGATTLPPCDPELFAQGTTIFVTHTIRSWKIETWVRAIAARSGQRVDWSMACGRAVVVAIGDIDAARRALVSPLPRHDKMWRQKSMRGRGAMSREWCDEYLASMREYSGLVGRAEAEPSGAAEQSRYVAEAA